MTQACSKVFLKLAFAVSILSPAFAIATTLEVDPAHSSVQFQVKHLMISTIPGFFGDFKGSIDLNDKDITKSKVEFTVKTASINTHVQKRDDHLRSNDFFNAEKFPEAKFVSTSIKKAGKNKYTLEGDLTIRDVTKKAKFKVNALGKAQDPAMKVEKTVFNAEGEINRKDFGVNYGPDAIVSDKVKLAINLETAVPAAPAAATSPTPAK